MFQRLEKLFRISSYLHEIYECNRKFSRRILQPSFSEKITKHSKQERFEPTGNRFKSAEIYDEFSNSKQLFFASKTKAINKVMIDMTLDKDNKLIILEGTRLINDAIKNQIRIKYLFFTSKSDLEQIYGLDSLIKNEKTANDDGTKLIKVLYKDLKIYSSLITPPGFLAIAELPDQSEIVAKYQHDGFPLILICDTLRDPGNLGTILRTSVAAGIRKVILTKGCVDAWNPKVLKSAAGAHFRLQIEMKVDWNEIHSKLPERFDVYLADSKTNLDHHTNDIKSSIYHHKKFFDDTREKRAKILIIGNEAFGLSGQSYEFASKYNGERLRIPLYCDQESLNSAMASSIIIYEIRKQFDENDQNP
ncbi:1-phosphatidylinositol 4 5-bisphosphate phosphodiesterase-like [Sarcoptes scabiei]|nr:1-phosphatidylinositol 4 5-bisphosphate phosphodiesterase-like [Sarcoptes scabiei]